MFQLSRYVSVLTVACCLGLLGVAGETTWTQAYKSVSASDVAEILTSLQWAGAITRYERFTDSSGDPAFRIFADSAKITLLLYGRSTRLTGSGWTEEVVFTSLQLYRGFAYEYRTPPSCTTINRWNREYRQSRAYIDTVGDPCIEADLSLKGGVSSDAIKEWFRVFVVSSRQFERYIGW